jgi:hypothetical protein
MRIREAQKHMNPTDLDPQNYFNQSVGPKYLYVFQSKNFFFFFGNTYFVVSQPSDCFLLLYTVVCSYWSVQCIFTTDICVCSLY